MPKSYVGDTFEIAGQDLFVMAGSIVEGEIRAGMFVRVPFTSLSEMTARIHCIEFARRRGGSEDICLCIKFEPDTLELWRGLNIEGETFEVTTNGSD